MTVVVIILNIYSDLVCMCLMRWGQFISAKLLLCFQSLFWLRFVCISPCPIYYFHLHLHIRFSFSHYSTNGFLSLWVCMCLLVHGLNRCMFMVCVNGSMFVFVHSHYFSCVCVCVCVHTLIDSSKNSYFGLEKHNFYIPYFVNSHLCITGRFEFVKLLCYWY